MPLTDLQKRILESISSNRSPENHVAGGSVINMSGPRYSDDIDLFSDRASALHSVVAEDARSLVGAGLGIEWQIQSDTFFRANVTSGTSSTRLDWGVDSDYRFFPAEKDDIFGYRLHPVDLATNKILAAVDRQEPRDIIDLTTVSKVILPLGPISWAAAEKSPGRSPDMIIGSLRARARLRQEQVDPERLDRKVDAGDLNNWLRRKCEEAQAWIDSVPPQFGFGLFMNAERRPGVPDFSIEDSSDWTVQSGSRKGSWPSSPEISSRMIESSAAVEATDWTPPEPSPFDDPTDPFWT